jgi:hypothetical protein
MPTGASHTPNITLTAGLQVLKTVSHKKGGVQMDCQSLIQVILAIGRVSVLILGMLAGIFSVYLGWRLYRDAVISKTTGELTYKTVKVALTATGPGVFLALFGTYLLYAIVSLPVDLSIEEAVQAGPAVTQKPVRMQAPAQDFRSGFMTVQASTAPATPAAPPCLIRKVKATLYSGDSDDITPQDTREAFAYARTSLTSAQTGATSAEIKKLRKAVTTLESLQKGIL